MEPSEAVINRRRFIQGTAAAAMGLTGASLLAGCGGSGSTASARSGTEYSAGPKSGGSPVRGGTLRIGMPTGGQAETVDVRKLAINPDLCRSVQFYDPLVFASEDSGVAPALATEWHSNADATVWTFKLRDGVVFHDGRPFTADDVVYTVKASWGSAENVSHGLLATIVDFDRTRKIDEHTVEIRLLRGVAQFPTLLTAGNTLIVQNGTTDWEKGLGTGPFKLESFQAGSRSTASANKDYWISSQPYVDQQIIDSSFADGNALFNALLAGNIDIVPGVSPALAKANAASNQIVLGNQPGPGFIAMVMHVDQAPFADPRVVRAMKLVADRTKCLTDVYDGFATIGNDCVGHLDQYWASDLKGEYDPEQAKSLLKAAGRSDLTLELVTAEVYPGVNEQATFFAQQAAAAGIKIKIKEIPSATYYSAPWPNRPLDMTQWSVDTNSLANFYSVALNSKATYPETGWHRSSADKLFYDALQETNGSRAAEKWHAVQKLQYDQGGYIVLNNINWVDGYTPRVRGVSTTKVANCDGYKFSGAWLASA